MTTHTPTQSDIAAAKEIYDAYCDTTFYEAHQKAPAIISRHMQPERELLLELADTPDSVFNTVRVEDLIDRARTWKKEQGL